MLYNRDYRFIFSVHEFNFKNIKKLLGELKFNNQKYKKD